MNEVKVMLQHIFSLRICLVFGLVIMLSARSEATHIVGGNMYYKCLGNDMYEITFQMRRDCKNGADDAPHRSPHIYLSVFTRDGQFCPRRGDNGYIRLTLQSIDTLNTDPDDFCIDPGDEVCVSQATYVGIACLPANKDGHILAYQRCCRNETLTNIENPLETGGTWLVDITGQAMMECNSNPVFNAWPPVYICQNDDLQFDHSATDPDADSLVYSLCTPLQGATITKPAPTKASAPPYDSIVWLNPYGRTDMMGGTALQIDPRTGIMTATPDTKGQYLIGVMVREYRNGQLIGYVKRDFEFNVVACGDRPTADFEVLTDKCDGLTQEFQNNSTGASSYTWYFDHPNLSPSSNAENPTHTYDSVGTYKVVLIAENDQGCLDSTFKMIEVLDPNLIAAFDVVVECDNGLQLLLTDRSSGNQNIITWEWEVTHLSGVLNSNDQNPTFDIPQGGPVTITLKVTDENGCMASTSQQLDLEDIILEFVDDTVTICLGDETELLVNGNPDLTYTWTPQDGLKLNPPHNPRACPDTTTTYCVTATDGNCVKDGCITVVVKDTIPLEIMGNDSTCNEEVSLMAVLPDTTLEVRWYDDAGRTNLIDTGLKLNTTITTTTTFYAVVNEDEMCPSIASWTVTYFDAVIEDIDRNPIICFGEGMIELNPNGNPDYIYNWTPGEFLDNPRIANPKAMLDTTTVFEVVITNPDHPECPKIIEITVTVGDDFQAFLPTDTMYCTSDSVKVNVELDGSGLTVQWCDQNGNVVGNGDSLCFIPVGIDSIFAKVTDTLGCEKRVGMAVTVFDIDLELMAPDSVCAGDTFMLMLQGDTTGLVFEWEPSEDVIGDNTLSFIKAVVRENTTFTVTIIDGSGCVWMRSATIQVGGFPNGIVATADPYSINPGESTQLDVNVDNVTYMWSGEGLDFTDIKDPTATPPGIDTYIYQVKVTDDQGCMATDTVAVTVIVPDCEEGVFIPNAFSPNDDGHNDILFVRSNVIVSMELQIFNRWGDLMFMSNNIGNGWNGRFNGKPLPPDVYGYRLTYLCVDGEEYRKEGNVSLIK